MHGNQRWRFGSFDVVEREHQLLQDGQVVPLTRKAFSLLATLLGRPGELFTKTELFDTVWAGTVVTDAALSRVVHELRVALGDSAASPRFIATEHGLGFRFVAPLRSESIEMPDHGRGVESSAAFAQAAVAGPAIAPPRRHLPAPLDTLIGRDADLAALPRWLETGRLVTLLGPGGIGKTRLAQAVAWAEVPRFGDAVAWVDLAALTSSDRVVPAIAAAARVPLGPSNSAEMLAQALSTQAWLIVLDNCEHLIGDLSVSLRALLAGAAQLRVLATSRGLLGVEGERVWRLTPLDMPPTRVPIDRAREFPAIQLLEQRAMAVDQRFRLRDTDSDRAIELCRKLDGVPLAIEMAAAWLPRLGLVSLTERLADRLDFLRAPGCAAPSRQQTLRATLDWSYALLEPGEQSALRRLAVFVGSFGLEAAESVMALGATEAGPAFEALAGLLDKSLVKLEQFDPPRYRLAETTRLYARERLAEAGETDAALRLHGRVMVDGVNDISSRRGAEAVLEQCRADYEDLAAAFDRAVERRDAELAAPIVVALRSIDQSLGVFQATRSRVRAADALLPSASPAARARLCAFIASCGWIAEGSATRFERAREAVQLWRDLHDQRHLHWALCLLATEAARSGRHDEAARAIEEARRTEDSTWPPQLLIQRAFHAGQAACFADDGARYRDGMAEALALSRRAGLSRFAAMARGELAAAVLMCGEPAAALALARAAADELLDQPTYRASALCVACDCLLELNDTTAATAAVVEALPMLQHPDTFLIIADRTAMLTALAQRAEDAALLLGHADALRMASQSPRDHIDQRIEARAVALIDRALGPDETLRLRAAGSRLAYNEAAALAWGLMPPAAEPGSPLRVKG